MVKEHNQIDFVRILASLNSNKAVSTFDEQVMIEQEIETAVAELKELFCKKHAREIDLLQKEVNAEEELCPNQERFKVR